MHEVERAIRDAEMRTSRAGLVIARTNRPARPSVRGRAIADLERMAADLPVYVDRLLGPLGELESIGSIRHDRRREVADIVAEFKEARQGVVNLVTKLNAIQRRGYTLRNLAIQQQERGQVPGPGYGRR